VEDYEHLVDSLTNHPKDRHVLAAAVAAEADVIVTLNTRHFPAAACEPHSIEVLTPDALLCEIADAWPELVITVLIAQAARKTRPPMSLAEMLGRLELHAPRFVGMIRPLEEDDEEGAGPQAR
ncbi:MAG: PIN domain-containing protein, partial [Actinobacteria bacterium]|nr:PIN domain-containing protein [Actinomycetota bacterium]